MTISRDFRDMIKESRYERLVNAILNQSTVIITDTPLIHIDSQPDGEPDFIDTKGNKYDVKLLFDSKQGELVGARRFDIKNWIESMMDESAEFSEYIYKRGEYDLSFTTLYSIMKDRITSLKEDEIGVLFCPFPIVNDKKGSIFMQHATDFLQAVYEKLVDENVVTCNDVLFLYPSMEKDVIVLRNGNTRTREYINTTELSKYISFDTIVEVE